MKAEKHIIWVAFAILLAMGLYIKQDEARSQLNSKVAADLSRRLVGRALENDDAKSAVLLKDRRKTTNGGLFWTTIAIVVIVAALLYFIFIF